MVDVIVSLRGGRRARPASPGGGGGAFVFAFLACASFLVASVDARAIEFVVDEITVSEGGDVVGLHASIPVGGTVTIAARVVDPAAQAVYGLGASYYGWDPNLLSFSSGSTVVSLFHQLCIAGVGAFNGLTNYARNPLFQSIASVGGSSARKPRVRILAAISATARTANPDDPGLDGQCGGGDSQFRVTFSGISDGETTVTIGTGDDLGGVIAPNLVGTTSQATNASILVTVPEPGLGASIATAVGWMLLAGRRRSRSPSRRPGTSRQSASA